MNYLAHAYLSFKHPDILAGNMISDFIKGKKQYDYSPEIQKGIKLHRAIDQFTDAHEATKEANRFFKPVVGLYAGAFTDVTYDHFLANDTNEFSDEAVLGKFAADTYIELNRNINSLAPNFQKMLPYMISHNWLYNYRYRWGMEKSFEGVTRKATYLHVSLPAFTAFETNYDALQKCYKAFFPALKSFSFDLFSELTC